MWTKRESPFGHPEVEAAAVDEDIDWGLNA